MKRSAGFTLVDLLFTIFILLVGILLLIPATLCTREAARQMN